MVDLLLGYVSQFVVWYLGRDNLIYYIAENR